MNERILLIKHGALGDIIQGFDAFDSLRKGCPDAHISLLTTKPYEKLMKSSNWFDEVLIDQRATAWNIFQTLRLKSLLRMGWDKIIDLQCSKRTANYARLVSKGTRWFGIAPNATDFMPDFTGITNRQRMLTAVCMAGATEIEPDLLRRAESIGVDGDSYDENELDIMATELKDLCNSNGLPDLSEKIEMLLTYIMFPNIALPFFKELDI